jgi:hypothetical protein
MCQYRFINLNKFNTVVQNVDNERGSAHVRQKVCKKFLHCCQFCCQPKSALRILDWGWSLVVECMPNIQEGMTQVWTHVGDPLGALSGTLPWGTDPKSQIILSRNLIVARFGKFLCLSEHLVFFFILKSNDHSRVYLILKCDYFF